VATFQDDGSLKRLGRRTATLLVPHIGGDPSTRSDYPSHLGHALGRIPHEVVAAEVHLADQGDTATMPDTLNSAAEHLNAVDATPTPEAPADRQGIPLARCVESAG
jgi:hypothetical protein